MSDTMSITDGGINVADNVAAFTESFERIVMPIYEREFGSTVGIESVLEVYPFTEAELVHCTFSTEGVEHYTRFTVFGKVLQLGIALIESADLGVKDFKILSYLIQTEPEPECKEPSVLRVAFKAQYKDKKIHRVYLIHSSTGTYELKNSMEPINAEDTASDETNFFK